MQNNNTLQDFVITFLNENLPAHLVYHNHEHTIYVTEKANEIGQHENCTADELRLLNAAALWHDTGFVTIYKGHEEVSCTLAQKHLPQFGFTPFEIELICNMIMATKIPQSPKTGQKLKSYFVNYIISARIPQKKTGNI
jgi:predicted metal-dependent HD superfamily phosphohydrolase